MRHERRYVVPLHRGFLLSCSVGTCTCHGGGVSRPGSSRRRLLEVQLFNFRCEGLGTETQVLRPASLSFGHVYRCWTAEPKFQFANSMLTQAFNIRCCENHPDMIDQSWNFVRRRQLSVSLCRCVCEVVQFSPTLMPRFLSVKLLPT